MKKISRNEECWCGSGKKYKNCHALIMDKMQWFKRNGVIVPDVKLLKSAAQIEGIKKSSRINIAVLDYISENIHIGMTTEEINQLVYEKTISMDAIPAPLGYEGFPKSVCTSVNDQVCHGIPSENVILKDGDIINVDVSTIYNGYYSDSSRMFCLGNVEDEKKRLVQVAKDCIGIGLREVKPWKRLGDLGFAINEYVKANGFTVVRDIGGHGIGLEFHEEPFVSYVSKRDTEMLLVPGMVFTIEPMINAGTDEVVFDENDNWTIYTLDGKPSAQWEITVLVTNDGYEILAY